MKYVILFPLLFAGCIAALAKLDESSRTFYLTADYESSFQKCVYYLSKESYLIIHANKTDGDIITGYKDVTLDRSIRLNINLKKITENSTRVEVMIHAKDQGSDNPDQDQNEYREIINSFISGTD